MKFAKKTSTKTENYFWNVLIVDDDEDIHSLTKVVLKNFTYKDMSIKFYDAYNIEDTKEILNQDIEFSLILLDIIMEQDDAGLVLTKYIREELNNSLVRIILRTGQPGIFLEEKIIIDYDINDYKEKTELTSTKLKSSIISSFRSYEELKKIKEHEEILERKVEKNIIELRKKDKLIEYQNRISQHTDLLNMLAHQWRQPLNVISVNANNLLLDIELDNIDKESFKKISEGIIEVTQNLSTQINDFISHYKPSSSKTEFTLGELFKRILILSKKRAEESKVKIINEIDKDYVLNTYKSELEQIIVHLIDNSINAYEINKDLPRIIKLETKIEDDKIIINIEDSAGGLSDDIKDKIFIPYFSTKEDCNDTGLGLYMSKLLVEKHLDGELTLSNKNQGCVAKIELFTSKN